jgi:hypothetical protein
VDITPIEARAEDIGLKILGLRAGGRRLASSRLKKMGSILSVLSPEPEVFSPMSFSPQPSALVFSARILLNVASYVPKLGTTQAGIFR